MRISRSVRQMFLLLAVLLMGSLVATGCSLIPDVGGLGGDSGSSSEDKPRGGDGKDTDAGELPDLGDLPGLGGNAEACLSVTAVVLAGSTLAFFAKLDPSGDSTKEMADTVEEAMKKVPADIKGDLENLLAVIDESSLDGKKFDDKKFERAMEPIGKWAEKNCTGK